MRLRKALLAAGFLLITPLLAGGAAAQTLRIGLAEDPDVLDPTLARTFVGRIVFAALCDKLVDISPELDIVPQLATSWQWTDANRALVMKLRPGVKFHDGEPFDAAAVKFSIERHLTLPGSNRKAEISAVSTANPAARCGLSRSGTARPSCSTMTRASVSERLLVCRRARSRRIAPISRG